MIKDYFSYQGNGEIRGSRDSTREAFENNLIDDGEIWMDMILSRNLTSHTYDEQTALKITEKVLGEYIDQFNLFQKKFTGISKK